MNVVKKRPKQETGVDCRVCVRKYINAIMNEISFSEAVWDPYDDVDTFSLRIA